MSIRKRFIFAILVTGLGGMVAQIVLLRELLITFYGNELSIGIILANWLLLEAGGSFFLGKIAEYLKRKFEAFVILQIIFSLSLPLAVYFTRILKGMLTVTPGESFGLVPIFYSSFFILLPVSIIHGALFTFSCKIYSGLSKEEASSIGKVYVVETLGTLVGGIILTYLLIPYFHSLQIALSIALLNFLLCIFLLKPFWQDPQRLVAKILSGLSLILFLLGAFLVSRGGLDKIHWLSIRQQWKNQEVIHYQNSVYGNIAVIQKGKQYTFFSNGIPIITTPFPNTFFVEEFAHLPLLFHPQPEEILIISGGAGGVIQEILKYPTVKRIDYAELDPLLLKIVKKFSTPLTEAELGNPKVQIKYIDGRLFLKSTPHKYDLVMVGFSQPQDLQLNRFFTQEFFSLVKNRLKEEGILVMSLPGSLTYLSEELKDLNACILNTLKTIYPYIRIIPGDATNLFLASLSKDISLVDITQLTQRLKERRLKVSLINPAYIEYKLNLQWLNWFLKSLEGSTKKINQDFKPLGLFYSLIYWNALFSPYFRGLFRSLGQINLQLFFIPLFLLTLVFLFLRPKIKRPPEISIPFCIATTGFAGMLFQLVLIFTFQALYGYVFYWIGILVSIFMAGVAVAATTITALLNRIKQGMAFFIWLESAIVIFAVILPLIFFGFSPYLDRPAVSFLLQVVFLILSFLSGLLVGSEFPLANKIYLTLGGRQNSLSGTVGLLYGVDLLGGWLGGIIGGAVLLPVLGLVGTCVVMVMLKLSSLIILLTASK